MDTSETTFSFASLVASLPKPLPLPLPHQRTSTSSPPPPSSGNRKQLRYSQSFILESILRDEEVTDAERTTGRELKRSHPKKRRKRSNSENAALRATLRGEDVMTSERPRPVFHVSEDELSVITRTTPFESPQRAVSEGLHCVSILRTNSSFTSQQSKGKAPTVAQRITRPRLVRFAPY
ncbi:hypothetical protein FRC18_000665 [Serendipita sp. 400]|nr:hypothetical protein FRC18_000665 [Serendipita sp. 400]